MKDILSILEKILEKLENTKNEKTTFSIREAAEYLGIGHEKIRELIDSSNTDFPYFKVGYRAVINRKMLDAWVDKVSEEHRRI